MLVWPGVRRNVGGAAQALRNAPFWAPLKTSLVLARGTGDPTFTRATTATVEDHEGLLKTAIAGEARFQGARRVRNYVQAPETPASWLMQFGAALVSSTQIAPDGTATAAQVSVPTDGLPGAGSRIGVWTDALGAAGNSSVFLKADVAGNITLQDASGSAYSVVVPVTTAWQRFETGEQVIPTSQLHAMYRPTGSGVTNLYIWHPQREVTNGQAVKAPSEYVSVGVLSAPYHGAGVDGIKYFATENGNSVASNVVTEAQGTPIPDATLDGYFHENARTQYLGVTDAPATQTTSSLGTGTYTLWMDGTGSAAVAGATATITGAGTATDGSPVTFTVTVAGTVTVTVTGSPTRFQIENGAFKSSYITNSGAAGTSVPRNADVDSLPTAGNILAAAGTIYMEITPQHAPSGTVFFWGTYVDADNYTALLHDGTNLIFRKRIAASNYDATIAWAFTSGTKAKVAASWGASGTTVYLNGTAGTPHANTTAAQIAATMQIGADGNGANQPFAAIKNDRSWLTQLPGAVQGAITR